MTTIKSFLLASALTAFGGIVMAQDLAPLNSDEEPDRMDWSELTERFGDLPKPTEGTQIGGVSKALTNEYWRSLGEGYKNMTDAQGVGLAYQAAPSEGDQLGQLSIAENMILQGYQGLLVSPQTDNNLQPAMEPPPAGVSRSSTSMTP